MNEFKIKAIASLNIEYCFFPKNLHTKTLYELVSYLQVLKIYAV